MNDFGSNDFCFRIFRNSKSLDIDLLIDFLMEREISQTILQIIDPAYIVSENQLRSAVYHATKSFENQRNIARNKANELVIRLAGKRQISSALNQIGIKETSQHLLVIAFGNTLENNMKELEKLVNQFNLNNEEIEKILPLSGLKELSTYYECQEDYEEIEKRVLERIAAIEIL